jgi:RNA polymerase sigma-70 factor (ECF subfamily)
VSLIVKSQNVADERLMELFLDGDHEALETLVRRYQEPLFAFAVRTLDNNRAAAEDAFQETFLRVYRRRSTYRKGRSFRAWIYQICLNVCRDALRKGKRCREVPLSQGARTLDASPGPAELAVTMFEAARVRRAVAQLPKKQSDVVLLAHYQGLAYPEIAQVLDIPVGTVKSRNHTAIRNLSRFLGRV